MQRGRPAVDKLATASVGCVEVAASTRYLVADASDTGVQVAAIAIVPYKRGKQMQRDRKVVGRMVSCIAALLCMQGGSAWSQTTKEPVPDFAALIGVPMSKADAARMRARGGRSTAADVERRIAAAGIRRSAADRAASESLNRRLAQMPETRAQAMRESEARGDGFVYLSLEELLPMHVPPDGAESAGTADIPASNTTR